MSVQPRVEHFEQVCHSMVLPGSRLIADIICKEIDRKTFLEMWDLSRPGGEAEECFLRIKQTEFYDKRLPRPNPIETMPNVSSSRFAD